MNERRCFLQFYFLRINTTLVKYKATQNPRVMRQTASHLQSAFSSAALPKVSGRQLNKVGRSIRHIGVEKRVCAQQFN